MSEDITILKDALSAHLETLTPCELADELSVHNAHVYRARKGDFSPTLVAAMRDAGMIPPRPPYRYFKIRRDDAERAAYSILVNLGYDYSIELIRALSPLIEHLLPEDDPKAAAKKFIILRDNSVIEVDEDEYISLEDRGWDW